MEPQPAVVMGDLNLVRALALAGVRSVLVAPSDDPARLSRFVTGTIHCDDFEREQPALLDRLEAFARTRSASPVLFYEQDSQLLLISRHRDRLRRHFRFVIAAADLVEDLVDKGRFRALADRMGLPVPRTRQLDLDGPPDDGGLGFPLLLKPLTRFAGWGGVGGSAKAIRVEDAGALARIWPELRAGGLALLAQELVPGAEDRIESYHVYVDETGRVAGEFTGRKLRTLPREFGYSTALTLTDAEDVRRLGRELTERLGLRGVAKFDFKRAPDGRLVLLEVNPRFNLWHHLGAAAGVNLMALVHADLTGTPRPTTRRVKVGATWCNLTKDRRAASAHGLSTGRWLAWAARCDATGFSLGDPLPTLANLLRRRPGRGGSTGAGHAAGAGKAVP